MRRFSVKTPSLLAVLLVMGVGPALAGSPNAALRYWAAFAEMENPPKEADAARRLESVAKGDSNWDPSLASILDANADALSILRRGTVIADCDWGLDPDWDSIP